MLVIGQLIETPWKEKGCGQARHSAHKRMTGYDVLIRLSASHPIPHHQTHDATSRSEWQAELIRPSSFVLRHSFRLPHTQDIVPGIHVHHFARDGATEVAAQPQCRLANVFSSNILL